jgi:hypothetical protein
MKKIIFLLVALSTLFSASTFAQYDDVYYDPTKGTTTSNTNEVQTVEPTVDQNNNNHSDQQLDNSSRASQYDGVEAGDKNTYITNNYYNNDDYNDYYYTSRLRRYYRPTYGYGYWDNYYTNYYYYDNNPFNWGNNIYSYTPNYYWNPWGIYIGYASWGSHNGWNWGRPCYAAWYDPYGWNSGWSNNYYGYNYGYNNNYGYGYNQGYYNGYNQGYNQGYNNGYYNNYAYNYGNGWDDGYWGPRKQMETPTGNPSNTTSVKTGIAINNLNSNIKATSNPNDFSTPVTLSKPTDYTVKSDVAGSAVAHPSTVATTSKTITEIPKSGVVVTDRNNAGSTTSNATNSTVTTTNAGTPGGTLNRAGGDQVRINNEGRTYQNQNPPC